jgi:Tol biopolymer transport system component
MAVRFNLATLEVIGEPISIIENVMQAFSTSSTFNTGAGQFSISDTGRLVYAANGLVSPYANSLVWVDQEGNEQQVTDSREPYFAPRLSPDGQRIAYQAMEPESKICVYDINRKTHSPLPTQGMALFPIWTPDGKRLLFSYGKSVIRNLFWQPFDGSSPMELLTPSQYSQAPGSWSSDGKTVALVEFHPGIGWDIALLDISSHRLAPLLNEKSQRAFPEFSPDGRWIAYASTKSRRQFEVYVQALSGLGNIHQISAQGGDQPLWARDGRQLFYRWQDQVWAVDVKVDRGDISFGKPHMLFKKPEYLSGGPIRNYDLSLDSQRFLMVRQEQRKLSPVTEVILVQDWFENIIRLLPAMK